MKSPAANLGPDSQPWGRWVDALEDRNSQLIDAMQGDANSVGMQFRARADNMQNQINGIPSVSEIRLITVPPFSVTRAFSPTARQVYDSSTLFVNPPGPDQNYTLNVIVNMHASAPIGLFSYSDSLLRLNGVDFMFNHENGQPNFNASTTADFSIMGTIPAGGAPTSIQFAISAAGATTVNFAETQIWCIYSGSIA